MSSQLNVPKNVSTDYRHFYTSKISKYYLQRHLVRELFETVPQQNKVYTDTGEGMGSRR